jgi:hypothetical protein
MISFRKPVESDKETIMEWIMNDEEHKEKGMSAEFFFSDHALAMVIGDLYGPGLYVRLDSEPPDSVRLHIQFGPSFVRSGKTLLRAWPEFKDRVIKAGIRRMVFESKSPSLVGFCRSCFEFSRVGESNDYELILA